MKMKKFVAMVALAGALTAGTAGVAYAADSSGSGSGSGQPAATAQGHPGLRLRIAIRRHAAKIVADTLGVSVQDLRTALKGGQTITQYAQSLTKDPGAVKTALVNAADKLIQKALANHRIDQARADQLTQKVPGRVDTIMNHQFGQHGTV
ncbi:MAG TPA: hypothetical protein VEP49_16935 [Acidimicrobiia bacterium]|nr:hypothetical protein [Acidimicrobiia bacterium]